MRIAQVPSGEYYLRKDRKGNPFVFSAKAKGNGFALLLNRYVSIPKELVGKRFRLKVEFC